MKNQITTKPKLTRFFFTTKDGRQMACSSVTSIRHTADNTILKSASGSVYIIEKNCYDVQEVEIDTFNTDKTTQEHYEEAIKKFKHSIEIESYVSSNSSGNELVDLIKKYEMYRMQQYDAVVLYNNTEVIR